MRDLLRASGDDANRIGRILEVSREFSRPGEHDTSVFEWRFTNFSDLILRSVPILSNENETLPIGLLFQELMELAHLQVNLLARGVLIRGAVTVGRIFMDDGLAFGPALVDAYRLESSKARYPRIIVDNIVFDCLRAWPLLRGMQHTFKDEMQYLRSMLRRDRRGVWFLDYLRFMLENSDDTTQYGEFVAAHKALVESRFRDLKTLSQRADETRSRRAKFRWLARYHNEHVSRIRSKFLKSELGLAKRSLYVRENVASI